MYGFLKKIFFALYILFSGLASSNTYSNPENFGLTGLEAVDLYKTAKVNIRELANSYKNSLQEVIDAYLSNQKENYELKSSNLAQTFKSRFGFSYVKFSFIKYFNLYNSPGEKIFLTIDVVDKDDLNRNFQFLPKPTMQHLDPDNLIQLWGEYQKIGFELLQTKAIDGSRVNCKAFHCIFGHEHPKLHPYEKIFIDGVAKNYLQLIRILQEDKNSQARANAAFLLAYSTNGYNLVEILKKQLLDCDGIVRNNILRVFSDIANFHSEIDLPLLQIISMLDFPDTTDRNKSVATISELIQHQERFEQYKELLKQNAVPHLKNLEQLQQPNQKDFAKFILQKLGVH